MIIQIKFALKPKSRQHQEHRVGGLQQSTILPQSYRIGFWMDHGYLVKFQYPKIERASPNKVRQDPIIL